MATGETGDRSATALKYYIRVQLGQLRDKAGLSQEDMAERLECSLSKVRHYEGGRSIPGPLEIGLWMDACGVPERMAFFKQLRMVAKKGTDWWVAFKQLNDVPEWFDLFLAMESIAAKIDSFDALVVPGLFQTREYAAAVIRAVDTGLPEEEIHRRVDLRIARQHEVLDQDGPPRIRRVVGEPALTTMVGGPEVMGPQLEHLAVMAERPGVELRVLAGASGAHAGVDGAFTVMTFPDEFVDYLGMAYVQTRVQGIYYESPEEVGVYRATLTRLWEQAATPGDSLALVRQYAKEM